MEQKIETTKIHIKAYDSDDTTVPKIAYLYFDVVHEKLIIKALFSTFETAFKYVYNDYLEDPVTHIIMVPRLDLEKPVYILRISDQDDIDIQWNSIGESKDIIFSISELGSHLNNNISMLDLMEENYLPKSPNRFKEFIDEKFTFSKVNLN